MFKKILPMIYFLSVTFLLAQNYNPNPNDTLTSVRINKNKVEFKIYAPNADSVKIGAGDIPNLGQVGKMTKTENGVWSVNIDSLECGAYRYNFNVDGISVIDPKNPVTSESNLNAWSLIYVNGNDLMDLKDVPHGNISVVNYYSKSLNKFRRMHIYTPPGYENNSEVYPVFYLLHGAWDSDEAWPTVGRANFILDNLLDQGKIKPMIVVMPTGHTKPFRYGAPASDRDEFIDDFLNDIKPYIENNYRVKLGRENTAIAGLSMGGGHTINIAIPHLDKYAYIGVFSSGVFGIEGGNSFLPNMGQSWEDKNQKTLDDPELKKGLKLVWFATGKDDFLLNTSRATVNVLRKHNFNVIFNETEGGHIWKNWREYLVEFSQKLFK